MGYGSCHACGCSREECECQDREHNFSAKTLTKLDSEVDELYELQFRVATLDTED